jgi:hypothetical protein
MMSLAFLATTLLTLDAFGPVGAHEGHDHGAPDSARDPTPAAACAAGQAATRLPDGSLFVPKPIQRLLGIRTARAEPGDWPDTFTLSGHVIPDPNAAALVQTPLRGRIEQPEEGLPLLGASIREGQVLAYLVPILDAVDRTDSFGVRVPLTAAVGGVPALRNASPGQIVAGGETLFTVVDPQRLLVEALLYDTDHATHFTSASATTTEGRILRLTPLGSGYKLRGHALPIQFRIEPDPPGPTPGSPQPPDQLVVRQPLTVVATMFHGSTGLRIPSAAVQRGPDGAELVWLHVQPAHFRPQRVQVRALGAGDSVVTAGLAAGDRAVSDGAALLGQVR